MSKLPPHPPLVGLAYQRRVANITQATIARVIGVDVSHYSRIERGHLPLDIQRAAQLANYLGCSIDDLL